jgi:hypothetical protein
MMSINTETFEHYAFPTIVVTYHGPTDYKGSRWFAKMDRGGGEIIRRTTSYDDGQPTGARNALQAAQALWAKYLPDDGDQRVFIPGDLSSDSYVFLVVPSYVFVSEAHR